MGANKRALCVEYQGNKVLFHLMKIKKLESEKNWIELIVIWVAKSLTFPFIN